MLWNNVTAYYYSYGFMLCGCWLSVKNGIWPIRNNAVTFSKSVICQLAHIGQVTPTVESVYMLARFSEAQALWFLVHQISWVSD